MVLRASAESLDEPVDLRGIVDPAHSVRVTAGDELVAFTDAVLGDDAGRLDAARSSLVAALGEPGLVGAALIAANFSRNDRIANAIGIPLEKEFIDQSADFRELLGINAYNSAVNSLG